MTKSTGKILTLLTVFSACFWVCQARAATHILPARDADLSEAASVVLEPASPPYNLGGWQQRGVNDVYFHLDLPEGGRFMATLVYSREEAGDAVVQLLPEGGKKAVAVLKSTGSWADYDEATTQTALELPEGETALLVTTGDNTKGDYLMNLREIRLTPDMTRRLDGMWLFLDQGRTGPRVDIYSYQEEYRMSISVPERSTPTLTLKGDSGGSSYQVLDDGVIGTMRIREEDGKTLIDIDVTDDTYTYSGTIGRASEFDGVKVCSVGYDSFDWSMAQDAPREARVTKLEMAGAIIAVWQKYGDEPDDPALMTPEGLVRAIDGYYKENGYSEDWLFGVACDVADIDREEYLQIQN